MSNVREDLKKQSGCSDGQSILAEAEMNKRAAIMRIHGALHDEIDRLCALAGGSDVAKAVYARLERVHLADMGTPELVAAWAVNVEKGLERIREVYAYCLNEFNAARPPAPEPEFKYFVAGDVSELQGIIGATGFTADSFWSEFAAFSRKSEFAFESLSEIRIEMPIETQIRIQAGGGTLSIKSTINMRLEPGEFIIRREVAANKTLSLKGNGK